MYVMYADGNMMKSRVIRRAALHRAPNGKMFRKISNVRYVMKDGGIVEEGTPDDVICNPQDEYTKMLVEAVL